VKQWASALQRSGEVIAPLWPSLVQGWTLEIIILINYLRVAEINISVSFALPSIDAFDFLPARLYASAGLWEQRVRLYVRLSRAGIVSKRRFDFFTI